VEGSTTTELTNTKTAEMCVMRKREKSILIALAIGDGHLYRDRRYKSCSLMIRHSAKQEDFIIYKRDLLHSIIGGKKPKLNYGNNNGYPGIHFSKAHNYFRIIRNWLYKDNRKVISRYLLDKLTLEAIAIWYMDDGGLSTKKRNGRIKAYELFLNTHLSKRENQIIIDYFKEVWNVQFHQVKNKSSYRLRMSTREIRKFLPMIEEYIIPSMKYKSTLIAPQIRGFYKNS